MSAIIPTGNEDVASIAKLSDIFYRSGYFKDITDQAQAVVKILYGRELGFSPVVSMLGIHIIEGKPALSSNLLATLVKRSAPRYDYRVQESTNERCLLVFFRSGAIAGESEFTIEDAKRAQLKFVSGNGHPTSWTKFPKAMLFARALSAGIRAHCPDITACPLYTSEEMGATVNEEGEVKELPASAKPVERIAEPVRITRNPVVDPATPRQHEKESPYCSGAEAALNLEADDSEHDAIDAAKERERMGIADEFISLGQQRGLHRRFREELAEKYKPHADQLLRDWLAIQEPPFIDGEGKGSTKVIKRHEFKMIGVMATSYARSL